MKRLNKRIIYITAAAILLIVFVIISIILKNSTEEIHPTIIIDNFSDYFPNVGDKESTHVFQELYKYTATSIEDGIEIPESGALIRENSMGSSQNYTTALVDIDSLKLSLLLEIDESNPLGHRGVLFMCPDKKDVIYPNTVCSIYNNEGPLNIYWKHSYLIDNMIQSRLSSGVKQTIEDFVLSNQELMSAPKAHDTVTYTLTINEQSYINYSMKPIIYSITASVDDGRVYTIYINANIEDDLCGVYVTSNSTGNSANAIVLDGGRSTYLENWIHSLPGGEYVKIIYKDIF